MNKRQIKYILSFILALALTGFGACKGPMGPEGPQGPQGEQGPPGPVGPAGSDGSIIHAGQGTPGESLGKPGDFYLDLSNGYLYGPKMTEGWGTPFSLTGEDGPEDPQGPEGPEGPQGPPGEDGEDGRDGQDGEDGSRIYAGNGAPDSSLGKKGDYYLDKDNYDLYGPKTGSGWGTPINLQGQQGEQGDQGPQGPQGPLGEDGNANVTLYIFPPHDFTENASATSSDGLYIAGVSAFDVAYSTWLIYLQYFSGSDAGYYSMPGYGFSENSLYSSLHWFDDDQASIKFEVHLEEGPGEAYNGIHVFRIESSAVEDCTDGTGCKRAKTGTAISENLDLSDYQAVMDYYRLTEEDAVRISSP